MTEVYGMVERRTINVPDEDVESLLLSRKIQLLPGKRVVVDPNGKRWLIESSYVEKDLRNGFHLETQSENLAVDQAHEMERTEDERDGEVLKSISVVLTPLWLVIALRDARMTWHRNTQRNRRSQTTDKLGSTIDAIWSVLVFLLLAAASFYWTQIRRTGNLKADAVGLPAIGIALIATRAWFFWLLNSRTKTSDQIGGENKNTGGASKEKIVPVEPLTSLPKALTNQFPPTVRPPSSENVEWAEHIVRTEHSKN